VVQALSLAEAIGVRDAELNCLGEALAATASLRVLDLHAPWWTLRRACALARHAARRAALSDLQIFLGEAEEWAPERAVVRSAGDDVCAPGTEVEALAAAALADVEAGVGLDSDEERGGAGCVDDDEAALRIFPGLRFSCMP
jgi:hypothetical protein